MRLNYTRISLLSSWNKPDTDADGMRDAEEDHDGDGLTAQQEQEAGTSPVDRDTDADGLTDDRESTHGTDALVADTDGEGLRDGAEVRAGTDPDRDLGSTRRGRHGPARHVAGFRRPPRVLQRFRRIRG